LTAHTVLAERIMEFDLPAEIHRLQAETTWSTGQNARTLIKYDDFRVVLTALQAKVRIPEHKADGRISGHVLTGHDPATGLWPDVQSQAWWFACDRSRSASWRRGA
jgi:hypothetical protein